MKTLPYSLLIFLFFNCSSVFSQGQATVTGKVRDSLTKPVSFATVSLYKAQQLSQPLKSTYTGSDGAFKIKVDTGNYILLVSHSGFSNTSTNVRLQAGENVMEDIVLGTVVRTLQNVNVTIRKPLIEQSDDKIVYNVESDPAAKSENATDLLRKTPLVTVDGDGNVQLNGQSNF